jgi:hypothetical protein
MINKFFILALLIVLSGCAGQKYSEDVISSDLDDLEKTEWSILEKAEKTTPVGDDAIGIEDSQNNYTIKHVLLKNLPVSDPVQAAINAGGGGTGDGLTSQPTADSQWLGSTGANAYVWKNIDWYTQTQLDNMLAPSAIIAKLSGQAIAPSSISIPQSVNPGIVYMKPGSGAGGAGWAAPANSGIPYALSLPPTTPSPGQLLSLGSGTTVDYGGGLSLLTFPVTFVNPTTGGGTSGLTVVATDPSPGTLASGSFVVSASTGNLFWQSETKLAKWEPFSYITNADYPLILSATVPSAGDKLVVVYNQDMVDGTELGTWALSCSQGSYSLTSPTGSTTGVYTYPVAGGLVAKNDTCHLYYTMPTDGVEAEDDGAKLQSITAASVANNSNASTSSEFSVNQNFEGAGVDNGEIWEFTAASRNPDYSGENVIRGSQSLEMNLTGPAAYAITTFPEGSEKWVHFTLRLSSTGGANSTVVAFNNTASGATVFKLDKTSTLITVFNGTTSKSAAYSFVAGEVAHIWLHLDGTAKQGTVYIGSTNIRPATPILVGSIGNAIDTTIDEMYFKGLAYATDLYWYVDQVIVSSTEFTTVDE